MRPTQVPHLTRIPYDVPMPSERVQRVIDGYLDEIEVAAKDGRWNDVSELANTILELDDTNDDAQTFLKLTVSKSGSQETHSDAEKTDSTDESLKQDGTSIAELSDTDYIEFFRLNIEKTNQFVKNNQYNLEAPEWKALEECKKSYQFRAFSPWGPPEQVSRMLMIAEVNLGKLSNNDLSNLDEVQEFQTGYWQKRSRTQEKQKKGGAGFGINTNNSSITAENTSPAPEPKTDYWRKRQKLPPLENQDSGTSSSSDSLTDVEEKSQSWMTTILYFVVAAVIGGIILALLGVNLPEGGGGNAIIRFLVIPPIVLGLVWLVGKFKS